MLNRVYQIATMYIEYIISAIDPFLGPGYQGGTKAAVPQVPAQQLLGPGPGSRAHIHHG